MAQKFSDGVLRLGDSKWKSENENLIYTPVRTLPIVMRLAGDDVLRQHSTALEMHAKSIWKQLDVKDLRAQGIAERPASEAATNDNYPPNAFHTYWALRLFQEYRQKAYLPELPSEIEGKAAVAQLWARRTLATQTALISGGQRTFDAHQLAWALSTGVLCRAADGDQPTTADRQHIELYEAALSAFFSQQKEGRWPLYEPLFHYSQAGNAYCYTYETLAELLRLARSRVAGRVLRDCLRDYSTNLIEAWRYAKSTALELENGGVGWCSGHHAHRTRPEAWATASVFSYLQNLRCLIGYWAADDAKAGLSIKLADHAAKDAGKKILTNRGDTWSRQGTHTVGRQLAMLYLHPISASQRNESLIDPDRPLVDQSRSAVLFGPPGTSKTTVVEGLAIALGWNYVEVHASDFLSGGVDSVPRLADEIFRRLMELDHCVVLFDEIDELIRLRDDDGSDPFGRFLTTSMLPKLAKLWAQRRILFFVATNDIESADPAIKRSQRFDATIFVPPPSFAKKKKELERLLGGPIALTEDEVNQALRGLRSKDAELGVFALLRWDQLAALAHQLVSKERAGADQAVALRQALGELGKELARADWQSSGTARSTGSLQGSPNTTRRQAHQKEKKHRFDGMFERWRQQGVNERRDHRNFAALELASELCDRRSPSWQPYGSDGRYVVVDVEVERALRLREDGVVELAGPDWTAVDPRGVFSFRSNGW